MIRADKNPDGSLVNIAEGCPIMPGISHTCTDNSHHDPMPGTVRVVLSAWPQDGKIPGPNGFQFSQTSTDSNGLPVGSCNHDQAETIKFWTAEYIAKTKEKLACQESISMLKTALASAETLAEAQKKLDACMAECDSIVATRLK